MPASARAALPLRFFNILSLSEHNREKVERMSTVTSADGTTIDYDAYGNGPTVIFIGGTTQHRAIDQRTTEIATQLAAEGFTAVDYDRRSRHRSGDTPPWSLDREVDDVAALIEATGAPAALYTSSSGAAIALAAVTARLDVSALALYEPPYFSGSDGTEHITTLERMIDAGQYEEATPLHHHGNHRAAR
jgi:pimeloyl-ACP methyl ester carboxylesterase